MIKKPLVKKSKYGNRKVVIDGITFDSIGEGNRYSELRILEKKGEISNLRTHVSFAFKCGVIYIPDFTYQKYDLFIAEDYKGFRTGTYLLKRRMFLFEYVSTGIVSKFFESYKDGRLKEIKPPKAKKQ